MQTEKKLIILVDDDSFSRYIGMHMLEEKYIVAAAPSAKGLFSFLEKNVPALILLDIDMPEMDGFETIMLLKEKPETMNIPVIFLSSHIEEIYRSLGLGLGAVDYITKPYESSLLLKKVETHLKNINE